MSSRKLEGLQRLVEEGFFEEAGLVALRMYRKADRKRQKRLEKLVEPFETRSQHAALVSTLGMLRTGKSDENDFRRLFRSAAKGDDDVVAAEAKGILGRMYLRVWKKGGHAAKHLHAAAQAGDMNATYDLAGAYAYGLSGFPEDLDTALKLYERCIYVGGDPRAMYELAFLIHSGKIECGDYDVRALLENALEGGHEPSQILLSQLDDAEGPDPDEYPDIPVNVHPDDAVRLRMARNEVIRVFGGTDERAGNLIAAMHGFYGWDDLIDASRDREEQAGPFDEDQSPEEQVEMRKAQAEIVRIGLGVDMFTAKAVVELLRVTSRGALPGLDGIDDRIQQAIASTGGRVSEV
jgi:TPR repeat protein